MPRKNSNPRLRRTFSNGRSVAMAATIALVAVAGVALMRQSHAVNGNDLCQVNGHDYCLGAPNTDYYSPVVDTASGRNMGFNDDGGRFCSSSGCHPTGTLNFSGLSNKCAAAANNNITVVIKHCSRDNGIIWARKFDSNGNWEFINRASTQYYSYERYLTSHDSIGSQFDLTGWPDGGYKRFHWE